MKRLMSPALINWLQANQTNCTKADLFVITLPTGTTFYATDGQWDITVKAGVGGWSGSTTTFSATQYGRWMRGSITSEASFDPKPNTMSLTCTVQQDTNYPGLTVGLLWAAMHGLFDAATLTVYTAYMVLNETIPNKDNWYLPGVVHRLDYGTFAPGGLELKFTGTITKLTEIGRNKVVFECADPLYLLNTKIPTRLYQTNCPWMFCDVNCTRNIADYTVSFTAKSGSTQTVMTPVTAFSQPADYFTQGVVKCLTGQNAGLSQTVGKHDSSGNLNMMNAWLLPITAGDTFTVIKGCDKTIQMCALTLKANGASDGIDQRLIFGGMPFMPPPDNAI
jgi:hypothetical protein